MITIDNDYMLNYRSIDLRQKLKHMSNPSRASENFLRELSFRIYDYIIKSSTKFKDYDELERYTDTQMNNREKEYFKRAIAEQGIYMLSVGDINYMLPENPRFDISEWQNLSICKQTKDILSNLRLITKNAKLGSDFYFDKHNLDDRYIN